MPGSKPTQLFAERVCVCSKTMRKPARTTLRIYVPRRFGNDWRCEFEILHQRKKTRDYAFGVDSLQSLLLAVHRMTCLLRSEFRFVSWLGICSFDGLPQAIDVTPPDERQLALTLASQSSANHRGGIGADR